MPRTFSKTQRAQPRRHVSTWAQLPLGRTAGLRRPGSAAGGDVPRWADGGELGSWSPPPP